MHPMPRTRTERLNIRVTEAEKAMVQLAAKRLEVHSTAFARDAILNAARAVLAEPSPPRSDTQ